MEIAKNQNQITFRKDCESRNRGQSESTNTLNIAKECTEPDQVIRIGEEATE